MKSINNDFFVDVHCHLDLCKDLQNLIKRAESSNVKLIITQGTNPESNRESLNLSLKYSIVRSALGAYPIDALSMTDGEIDDEIEFIRANAGKIVAIGEVGIDFKESNSIEEHERQKAIFRKFVSLSKEIDKPIIVHSRKAELECIEILESMKAKKVVMHCFCGKFSLVKRIQSNDWYFSIPTSVKNSEHFQKVIKNVDINRLLCETDSPYLHPDKMPNNEPSNIVESYKKIADIKGISLEEARKLVFANCNNLFSF